MAKLQVGDTAPDFTLQDNQGHTIHLADYQGKNSVVLIFYPGDQTPGCTKQLCSARDDNSLYEKAGAVVFGVNPGSEASHTKFVEKHNLTTPLLVDKDLHVASLYDAVMGVGPLKIVNRTVVTINKDGKIVFYKRGMPVTYEILSTVNTEIKA